jgi:hypothetical protein
MHQFLRAAVVVSLWVCAGMALAGRACGQNLLDSNPGSPTYNNPSFESPDTPFVNTTADKWTTSGPTQLVDIGPPFGTVPIIAGCGIFENPPTVPGGRISGADGSQLAYIFANSIPDSLNGQVMDHAFTQVTSLTLQAGKQYQLTMGVANAQSAPPPDSVLTMSLFAYDAANPGVEQLIASKQITNNGDLNGLSLTDFSAPSGVIGGSTIGKQIGIRITTHTDPRPASSTGQFDFDNIRLTLIPEPGSALMLASAAFLTLRSHRRR